MKKVKYYYNKQSLRYERIQESFSSRMLKVMGFLSTSFLFALGIIYVSYHYLDSPEEKQLKREISKLKLEYQLNQKRLEQMNEVLAGLQDRDDNIYRVIFEAEPIPSSVRSVGVGGSFKYKDLEGFDNSDLMVVTSEMIDKVSKQMYVQSKSYDEINNLIKNQEHMLASIPAIMPVANKDLTRVASGYGMRLHPIYKTYKMHTGMDFTAPIGTDIYCTGDGVVKKVEYSQRGYGNHIIIDHGYGYETLYAHMNTINVKKGQSVKRGDLLGFVGNSGTSTGPHLHYEVHKNGNQINPVNFYYNDLTPDQFEKMIEISSRHTQSFD